MRMRVRNRHFLSLPAAATIAALTLGASACVGDSPTSADAPAAIAAPRASKADDRRFDLDGDGRLSRSEKEARKAAKKQEKREFERLVHDWKAYKKAVKEGNLRADLLRCEPQKLDVAEKRIGPKGGTIDVGRHSLVIPVGALTEEKTITARSVPGTLVEVEFQPHGLEFARPVELRLNYERCIVPQGWEQSIVYLGPGFRILESRPSYDDDELREVSGWLDHFSGYAVATRRPAE